MHQKQIDNNSIWEENRDCHWFADAESASYPQEIYFYVSKKEYENFGARFEPLEQSTPLWHWQAREGTGKLEYENNKLVCSVQDTQRTDKLSL